MVEISVGRGGQFESSEAEVIESLVVNDLDFISWVNKQVNRKGRIIGLSDCVWNFWRWEDWESFNDNVLILLSDFWNKECSHTRSCSSSKRVSDLVTLWAVVSFSFFSDNIKNRVNQFISFSAVTFCPVVSSPGLSKNEVIRSEKLSIGCSSNWN